MLSGVVLLSGAIFLFEKDLVNLGVFSIILIRGVPMVRNIFSGFQVLEISWPSLSAVIETFKSLEKNKELEEGEFLLKNNYGPKIEFKDVSYKYKNQSKAAINSISFEINEGEIVAIIGPSGAGKSTTIDFIPRLKLPSKRKYFY